MVMSKIQKRMADEFIRSMIKKQVKDYIKKDTQPTIEQIIQDINAAKLNTLYQYGYTEEEIRNMIDEAIRRRK